MLLATSPPIHDQRYEASPRQRMGQSQLDLARNTIDAGLPVHPVGWPRKTPLTEHGFKDATTDRAQIMEWWKRWPDALVSIPTGETTGIAVLDVDHGGEVSFADLLARLGYELPEDLSRVWSHTPSNGRHYYFEHEIGTTPRTRASDIAPDIDSRGVGGSIIIPENVLPDGRAYRWGGSGRFDDVEPMPRDLLYLMTFSARERATIMQTPQLATAIRNSGPTQWWNEMQAWREAERARIASRFLSSDDDDDGMRRQALHDLQAITVEFAALTDGRRQKLFSLACRVARYVVHGKLSEIEFRSALMDAARANGSLVKHGTVWAITTIRNAINQASRDPLPPLSRAFRSDRGSA